MKYMYVYILECADYSYYTGVTNDPEKGLIWQRNKEEFMISTLFLLKVFMKNIFASLSG